MQGAASTLRQAQAEGLLSRIFCTSCMTAKTKQLLVLHAIRLLVIHRSNICQRVHILQILGTLTTFKYYQYTKVFQRFQNIQMFRYILKLSAAFFCQCRNMQNSVDCLPIVWMATHVMQCLFKQKTLPKARTANGNAIKKGASCTCAIKDL